MTHPGTKPRITILIPTLNEERNIHDAIASASWADEVLVADSYSTDKTIAIATELGARIIERDYINSASQKNWAIPQAAHEWVMVLDSDERITPELRAEIQEFISNPDSDSAMRIYRANYFMGKRIRYCGWQDDSVLRVFPRDRTRYIDREVHADAVVEGGGGVRIAKARMPHYTFDSFAQYMKKFDRYTTWAAGDRARKTKKVTAVHLLGRPLWRFFKQYFLRLGVLDGRAGLIVCMLAAFSVFLKYAKLWERQQK